MLWERPRRGRWRRPWLLGSFPRAPLPPPWAAALLPAPLVVVWIVVLLKGDFIKRPCLRPMRVCGVGPAPRCGALGSGCCSRERGDGEGGCCGSLSPKPPRGTARAAILLLLQSPNPSRGFSQTRQDPEFIFLLLSVCRERFPQGRDGWERWVGACTQPRSPQRPPAPSALPRALRTSGAADKGYRVPPLCGAGAPSPPFDHASPPSR